MGRRSLAVMGIVLSMSLFVGACGGSEGEEGGEDSTGTLACAGQPITFEASGLPGDFPQPGELVLTSAKMAGPSQIVDGYWESDDIEEVYEEVHEELETAGYEVLFDEIEEDDAEISYRSADESTTGQIALRADCEEESRIHVHITNRPASS